MMSYALIILVLVIQCGQFTAGLDEFCADLYEPEGCFRDRRKSRALGKLILTDRDSTSPFTSGRNIDWGNFEVYVKSLACRCAKKAQEMNFEYFGLQYYGECFGGPSKKIDFEKYGRSDSCADGFYGPCERPEEGECVGKANANFVYKLIKKGGPEGSADDGLDMH